MDNELAVQVIRSKRRKKTVQAKLNGNKLVVYLPAGLSEMEESELIHKMKTKVVIEVKKVSSSIHIIMSILCKMNCWQKNFLKIEELLSLLPGSQRIIFVIRVVSIRGTSFLY